MKTGFGCPNSLAVKAKAKQENCQKGCKKKHKMDEIGKKNSVFLSTSFFNKKKQPKLQFMRLVSRLVDRLIHGGIGLRRQALNEMEPKMHLRGAVDRPANTSTNLLVNNPGHPTVYH